MFCNILDLLSTKITFFLCLRKVLIVFRGLTIFVARCNHFFRTPQHYLCAHQPLKRNTIDKMLLAFDIVLNVQKCNYYLNVLRGKLYCFIIKSKKLSNYFSVTSYNLQDIKKRQLSHIQRKQASARFLTGENQKNLLGWLITKKTYLMKFLRVELIYDLLCPSVNQYKIRGTIAII